MATTSSKAASYSQDFPSDMTGLHLAAYFGATNIARQLLTKENLNCADGKDRSPLSYAAEEGHTDMVKMLLGQESIDVNMTGEDGKAAISWAATNGHEDIVRLLLAADNIDKVPRDKRGRRPIFEAVEGGYMSIVHLLLDAGPVDIWETDSLGCSALNLAEEVRDQTMMRVLITKTLDGEVREAAGRRDVTGAAS
jgi:ankyrin repeat protein